MSILRVAAFSVGSAGGNPAGVMIADELPMASEMQRVAADVGYSETVFAMPTDEGWRVRYFSPESEVPFCGHATIALGAALALREGDGVFPLVLNKAKITVEGKRSESGVFAALQSPTTHSEPVAPDIVHEVLSLFGYRYDELDQSIPPAMIHAGANHLVLALNSGETLNRMSYDLDAGRLLMNREAWITVMLVFSESDQRFRARNAFASGGVIEDPATGAAAAAFAGYLRDIGWPHRGRIEIRQGEEMGMPSLLVAEISAEPGSSIRISGAARLMDHGEGRR